MNLKQSLTIISLLIVFGFSTACSGSRVPSAKTARSSSMSYYKKYGNKYSSTQFGHKNLENVAINSIEEISYNYAFVDAIVTFVDGHAARTLIRMNRRFPGGWRVSSWEMLQYR